MQGYFENQVRLPAIGEVIMLDTTEHPSQIYGGGSWELKFTNRFPVGAGGDYALGDVGGENTHTLTIDEMPTHDHTLGYTRDSSQATWVNNGYGFYSTTNALDQKYYDNDKKVRTQSTGGSQPHENRPPFYAVYFWKRIL